MHCPLLLLPALLLSIFGGCGPAERITRDDRKIQASASPIEGTIPSAVRKDGRRWTSHNLANETDGAFYYDDRETHGRIYGRLYTWEAARQGCAQLGPDWRLPTDQEWRALAKAYGGVVEDAEDRGRAAYEALRVGGIAGFDARLGGGRDPDGSYARLNAHGFYWTATETGPDQAWFYNFASGAGLLNRHPDGHKQMACSVRCIFTAPD